MAGERKRSDAAGGQRPRERRPEARPGELLDAAITVFAERGYRNTRLEEVAAAAGVTKGTIYHYFRTKEELLLRAVEHYHREGFERTEQLLREEKAPASVRIRLYIRKSFGSDPSRRKVLTLLLQGVANDVPEVHRYWLETGPLKAWRLLAGLVAEGQAAGEFRRDIDVEVACRTLVSGLILQLFWQKHADGIEGYRIDEDRLLDASVDAFLFSLETDHGKRP
jgi:AcrR family transcriptional regulator